jgi:hypothetical protein
MDESTTTAGLSARPAGYSVAAECLRVQDAAPDLTALGRLFGARPVSRDARPWFSGTIGELRVGRTLARLGPEWTVLHSVPVGKAESDIDHLLVGPAGVFTVNTKRHDGQPVWVGSSRILVGGRKTDHLRNSRHEASRAGKLLSAAAGLPVAVHPLIVIVGAKTITFKERPGDVEVLGEAGLLRWLGRRKPTLDTDTLARLRVVANDPRVWHTTADARVDPTVLLRFAALRDESERAYRRRLGWAAVAAVAAGLLVYTLAPLLMSVVFLVLGGGS